MNENLISIIVPVFNSEKYLERCIKSILGQSFSNFELLLIDDGSADESRKICETYSKTDKRIKYFYQENEGVSSARNYGLSLAKGDYITFVDSDDFVDNDYLKALLNNALSYQSDIVISNALDTVDGKKIPKSSPLGELAILNSRQAQKELICAEHFSFVVWGNLYRRDILKNLEFDVHMQIAEDGKFLMQAVKKGNSIIFIPERHYYWFIHKGSTVNHGFTTKFFDEIIF